MAAQVPIIGAWYQEMNSATLFKVVAIDDFSSTIELQYEFGDLDEVDLDAWQQMVLIPAAPPEDWRNSYNLGEEDFSMDDMPVAESWDDPLMSIEPDITFGLDEY